MSSRDFSRATIFLVTHNITGKQFIDSTCGDIGHRISCALHQIDNPKRYKPHIAADVFRDRDYRTKVLECYPCLNWSQLIERTWYWIDQYPDCAHSIIRLSMNPKAVAAREKKLKKDYAKYIQEHQNDNVIPSCNPLLQTSTTVQS
jgi:hypothetical protein